MLKNNENRKNYVLDANILAFDPTAIKSFVGNNVIIPNSEIKRLERMKDDKKPMVRYQSAEALGYIRQILKVNGVDYTKGIEVPDSDGVKLFIFSSGKKLNEKDGENEILEVVRRASAELKDDVTGNKLRTILVTRNLSLRVTATECGLEAEDYKAEQILADNMFTGVKEINFNEFYAKTGYNCESNIATVDCKDNFKLLPNEFVVLTDGNGKIIEKFRYSKKSNCLCKIKRQRHSIYGINPLNDYQQLAVDALMDPDITMVSLLGGPGTGKTLLSVAAAFQQTIPPDKVTPIYRRIIFIRPMVAAGEEMGFLPGDEMEKLKPWMGSLYDSIETLVLPDESLESNNTSEENAANGVKVEEFVIKQLVNRKLYMMPTTYMRGRTFHNAFIIVDEAQGITPHIMKMILTRIGKNSKIVLAGDPSDNQIDTELLDTYYNGLITASQNMKESVHSAVVHFKVEDTERSDFVSEVEKKMH